MIYSNYSLVTVTVGAEPLAIDEEPVPQPDVLPNAQLVDSPDSEQGRISEESKDSDEVLAGSSCSIHEHGNNA